MPLGDHMNTIFGKYFDRFQLRWLDVSTPETLGQFVNVARTPDGRGVGERMTRSFVGEEDSARIVEVLHRPPRLH